MPKPIEKQLRDTGGQGLLDIQVRNEAINIMWLKSYLNLDASCVLWADYADAIMMMDIPKTEKNIKPEM
jgi:hypothetical protein